MKVKLKGKLLHAKTVCHKPYTPVFVAMLLQKPKDGIKYVSIGKGMGKEKTAHSHNGMPYGYFFKYLVIVLVN